MKRAVVSFADTPFYQSKMQRLGESLKGKTDADFVSFTDVKQIGCEPHSVIPYKFKPYAIKKAIEMGYESILWADSPVMQIRELTDLFEHIERRGYCFFRNHGHPLGKWTNDKALNYYGKTREEAMNIEQIMACVMGLSVHNSLAMQFFREYIEVANELYPGSWDFHRHDQTVASFVINKLGMELLNGHETFFIYEHFKQVFTISESVCLLSK